MQFYFAEVRSEGNMVEKKVKNTTMATKEERAEIKKKVTKVDPDDDDTNVHRLVQGGFQLLALIITELKSHMTC